jgi:hypothetical protein
MNKKKETELIKPARSSETRMNQGETQRTASNQLSSRPPSAASSRAIDFTLDHALDACKNYGNDSTLHESIIEKLRQRTNDNKKRFNRANDEILVKKDALETLKAQLRKLEQDGKNVGVNLRGPHVAQPPAAAVPGKAVATTISRFAVHAGREDGLEELQYQVDQHDAEIEFLNEQELVFQHMQRRLRSQKLSEEKQLRQDKEEYRVLKRLLEEASEKYRKTKIDLSNKRNQSLKQEHDLEMSMRLWKREIDWTKKRQDAQHERNLVLALQTSTQERLEREIVKGDLSKDGEQKLIESSITEKLKARFAEIQHDIDALMEEEKRFKEAFTKLDVSDAPTQESCAAECKRIIAMITDHDAYEEKMEGLRLTTMQQLEEAGDNIENLRHELQDLNYDSVRISNQTLNAKEEECRQQLNRKEAALEELKFLKDQVQCVHAHACSRC